MAEIKSTLELALERSRGLSLSEEEKAEARVREMETKSRALLLALREGRLNPENLEAALEQNDFEVREIRPILIRTLSGALTLTGEDQPVLDALTALLGPESAGFPAKFRALRQEYTQAVASLTESAEKMARTNLATSGISGSAVQPNLTINDAYLQAKAGLVEDYEKMLKDVVGRLPK